MTEAEAKKKWCPLVREGGSGITAACNRWNGDPEGRCIGSDCMAWRWHATTPAAIHGYCGAFGEDTRNG